MRKFFGSFIRFFIFFIGFAVIGGLVPVPDTDLPEMWRLWAELIPLLTVAVFTVIFWLVDKRQVKLRLINSPVKSAFIGIFSGIVWAGTALGILFLTGIFRIDGKNTVSSMYIWVVSAFLNVVMQELLVRGYLYSMLKERYNIYASVIVTTALFTFLHAGAFEEGIVPVLNVVTMSLLMCAVLEYTGSLLAPVIMHTIWNIFGSIILGAVDLADDYPHMMNLSFSGSILLNGGQSKAEGSIVTLIVNVCLTLFFVIMVKKKKSFLKNKKE